MRAPCKKYGEQRYGKKPPFPSVLRDNQSEQCEHYYDGSEVHWPYGERLRAPVQWKVVHHRVDVSCIGAFQKGVCVGIVSESSCGRTSVEIRYKKIRRFVDSVGPGSGVCEVEPVFFIIVFKPRASANRVFRIFQQREQFIRYRGDSADSDDEEEQRGRGEPLEIFFLYRKDKLGYRVSQDDYGKIIGYLRVVGLDLQ